MDNHHVLHTSLHQQSTNFNTFSFGVKQIINAFSGGHFAFIMQFFECVFATSQFDDA
jgi:hypothetical protein